MTRKEFSTTRNLRIAAWTLAVGHLLLLSGCTSFDWTKKLPWNDPARQLKDNKYDVPVRMVAIWSPTTLSQPGKPQTRGLGGRLYFYNEASQAIPVEGQLIVYAYDNARSKEAGTLRSTGGVDQPDRKYAFTPEQFSTHFSPTDLGASYSVWIPWGPASGPQVELSLVPVFTATGGNIVMGQSSRHVLTGTNRATSGREELPEGVIQFEQEVKQTQLRSTTIELPEVTADRLSSAPFPEVDPQPISRAAPPHVVQPVAAQQMESLNAALPAVHQQKLGTPKMAEPAVYHTPTLEPTTGAALAIPRPWAPTRPRQVHYERPKFPVPASPAPPPARDPAPTSPTPLERPSGPAWSPESNQPSPSPESSSAGLRTPGLPS